RAKQGSRRAGVDEENPTVGSVGYQCPDEADEWRDIEKKTVSENAGRRTSGQSDQGFSGPERKKKNRRAVGDIVPMERPHILHGDRVGKYGAVAIELELIDERNDDKGKRPAKAGSHSQIAQKCLLAGRRSRCSLHCA